MKQNRVPPIPKIITMLLMVLLLGLSFWTVGSPGGSIMAQTTQPDYSALDRPEVLAVLFHPRREMGRGGGEGMDMQIPVAPEITLGARFHLAGKANPNILFFHGNGEIVADYDDLGPIYTRSGINFLPVDYRGYGRSGGQPSVAAMMADGRVVLDFVARWLAANGYTGPIIIMGRSLGSAPALDLAACCPERIAGLIIESGFAQIIPLLELLGVNPTAVGFKPEWSAFNLSNINAVTKPTLIIHAQFDHIIPFADGEALFNASPAQTKKLLQIPGANHNDILHHGFKAYMDGVQWLVNHASSP